MLLLLLLLLLEDLLLLLLLLLLLMYTVCANKDRWKCIGIEAETGNVKPVGAGFTTRY